MEPYGGFIRTMSGTGRILTEDGRVTVGFSFAEPKQRGLSLKLDRSILEGSVLYGVSPESQAYIRKFTGFHHLFEDGWFGVVYGYPDLEENAAIGRIARTNGLLAESVIESIAKAYRSLEDAAD